LSIKKDVAHQHTFKHPLQGTLPEISGRDSFKGEGCNTPGVTQGVHPGLPFLTYYHLWIGLGKVHQTWNSRS
jgi:hypothetical protein